MYNETLIGKQREAFALAIVTAYPSIFKTGNIEAIEGIQGGVQNYNYCVFHTDGTKYFLSLLRPEKNMPLTEGRLDGITKAIDHVTRKGVLFPAPKKGEGGVFYETMASLEGILPGVEGAPYCILSTWLPGQSVDCLNSNTSREFGQLLARFANAGKDFQHETMGSPLTPRGAKKICLEEMGVATDIIPDCESLESVTKAQLTVLKSALNDSESDVSKDTAAAAKALDRKGNEMVVAPASSILKNLATRLQEGLAETVLDRLIHIEETLEKFPVLPRTLCHKDLHKGNIFATEQGLAMLDPDWMGPQEIAIYDLAMTLAFESLQPDLDHVGSYSFNDAVFTDILAGYMSERSLSSAEKKALPAFMDIACTRFFARRWTNLHAEPENIKKAPDEFIDRATVLPSEEKLSQLVEFTEHYNKFRVSLAYKTLQEQAPDVFGHVMDGMKAIQENIAGDDAGIAELPTLIAELRKSQPGEMHIVTFARKNASIFLEQGVVLSGGDVSVPAVAL